MLQYKTMEFMLYLIHFDSCNMAGLIIQDEAPETQAEAREEAQVMSQHPRHHLILPELCVCMEIPGYDSASHSTMEGLNDWQTASVFLVASVFGTVSWYVILEQCYISMRFKPEVITAWKYGHKASFFSSH